MKTTELEQAILKSMLADGQLHPARMSVNFDIVTVKDREFTGVGFLTELTPSDELRLFGPGVNFRWGRVGARLNAASIETGYIVYVDDGYVTTVEGYTYGDQWPSSVEQFELYALEPGMELPTHQVTH
jgi:hypothetical protein